MISLFNKKSIIVSALVISVVLFSACSSKTNKSDNSLNATKTEKESNSQLNIEKNSESAITLSKNTTKYNEDNLKSTDKLENAHKSKETSNQNCGNTNEESSISSNDDKNKACLEQNISERLKNYIINEQESKPEAQKIKWSETFLNRVDIESLYKQYIDNGGNTQSLEEFAEYITLNAPIFDDWQELFKKDLYDTYGEEVVRVEHLKGDLYQAYIIKNGSEVPFVVVSSRTGYFHG